MKINEGFLDFKGYKTYYRIVNPDAKKTPLILLHGGPGSTHNYLKVLDPLAELDDRCLIMYDQIGCGKSPADRQTQLFNATTWLDELQMLRDQLNLDKVHILGQSWGGMLAILYAIEREHRGVKSFILSSTLSSAKLWAIEQHRYISYMPKDMQEAIAKAEKENKFDSKEYQIALNEFMQRHAFDVTEKSPECVKEEKKRGVEAYETAWGPNEFTPNGNLKDYDYTDRLNEIKEPCLVISGQMDLSTPLIAKTIYDNIPNSKWELFQYSRHCAYLEETEKYITVLKEWLNQND